MIGGTLALTQRRWHHFALAMLITAMALRSARALPLCALLLLPIANAAITRGPRQRIPSFLAYGDNLRALDARFSGLALVPLRAAGGVADAHARRRFPADQFPVAAYPHIPAGRAPVRARQVRRLSDLPLERQP